MPAHRELALHCNMPFIAQEECLRVVPVWDEFPEEPLCSCNCRCGCEPLPVVWSLRHTWGSCMQGRFTCFEHGRCSRSSTPSPLTGKWLVGRLFHTFRTWRVKALIPSLLKGGWFTRFEHGGCVLMLSSLSTQGGITHEKTARVF